MIEQMLISFPLAIAAPPGHYSTTETIVTLVFLGSLVLGLALLFWYMGRLEVNTKGLPRRGFTLEDLGELKSEGKVSEEEYQQLRALVAKAPKKGLIRKPLPPKQLKHVRHRFCPNCGYDLRATPDRCPECGRIMSPGGRPA